MADEEQSRLSAREVAAEYATGTAFDITECAREPIHLLGSVQSHGALLALADPRLTVEVASANTAALLGVAPEALLGLPAKPAPIRRAVSSARARLHRGWRRLRCPRAVLGGASAG